MHTDYLAEHYGLLKTRLLKHYSGISVDDVVQDTYCQALDSVARLGHPSAPAAWLYTIATRVIARQRLLAPPHCEIADLEALATAEPGPLAVASEADLHQVILSRVARMSLRRRHLFRGYYLLHTPINSLAREAGMTHAAVKTALWRVRSSLRSIAKRWKE
jgi:RNA polymerase sigma factor (sigma-70 family)